MHSMYNKWYLLLHTASQLCGVDHKIPYTTSPTLGYKKCAQDTKISLYFCLLTTTCEGVPSCVSYHMDASRGGAVPAVSGSMSATGPGRTNSRVTICVMVGNGTATKGEKVSV